MRIKNREVITLVPHHIARKRQRWSENASFLFSEP
jgi:hypothetical protein